MQKLSFDGTTRRIPAKDLSVGNRTVSIDPRIEIEAMGTLGLPSYAYKLLPICIINDKYVSGDRAIDKPVVLVSGTIVSLLTTQTIITSSLEIPTGSGTIPVHADAVTGAIVSKNIDDSYFGYEDSTISLLVPANGGSASTHAYTTLDDEFGAWTTSSDGDLVLAGNIPAGVVYNDVYMDIRGAHLNYELQDAVGVAAKGYITIPFVDTDIMDTFGSGINAFGNAAGIGAGATNLGYNSVYKKYAFYYFDGGSNEAVSGALVESDLFGRFVTETASAAGVPSVQTVGKVLATDSRFPKEMTDEIRTYPGLVTPNLQIKGLPTDLYLFVKDILTAIGADTSAITVKSAVVNGGAGYVRIKLDV